METESNNQTKKIERFVRHHFRGELKGKECAHLILRHVTAHTKRGSGLSEIITIERPGKITESAIVEIAQEILTASDSDAAGFGGVQTYCVQAFYIGSKSPKGRCTYRVDGTQEDEDEIEGSEPPSIEGLQKQLMRHNEALIRALVMSQHNITASQQRTIDRLSEQNEGLEANRVQLFLEREKLLSDQLDRDLAMQEADDKRATRAAMLKRFDQFVPLALNRMAGRKMLPSGDPLGEIIRNLKESIMGDGDRAQMIMEKLKPEERAMFLELLESAKEPEH